MVCLGPVLLAVLPLDAAAGASQSEAERATVSRVQSDCGQCAAAAAAPAPALPPINPDNYPAVSRDQIARALDAVRTHPGNTERIGELAMTLHAWHQFETAAAVYACVRALTPRFDWFYLGGLVESRRARHVDAAALLRQAVTLSPSSIPARLALADAQFESGEIEAARETYEGLTTGGGAPHARYGLGRALASAGEHEKAVREFDAALQLYPEFGAAWYARGLSLRRLMHLDEATESLVKARDYGSRWPAVEDPVVARMRGLRQDAAAHSDRASALQRQGDIVGAIEAYESAVAVDPAWVRARVNLIGLYGRQRQRAKAEQHFQELVDRGLRVAEAHYNFAVCLATEGDAARAADQFRTALEIAPDYVPAWIGLAQLAEATGRLAEAEEAYRSAARHAPDDAATQFNLARMLLARRQGHEAIAVLQQIVIRDHPDRARYLFALATAHVQAGDSAAGRRYALEARDLAHARGQVELARAIERDLARLP